MKREISIGDSLPAWDLLDEEELSIALSAICLNEETLYSQPVDVIYIFLRIEEWVSSKASLIYQQVRESLVYFWNNYDDINPPKPREIVVSPKSNLIDKFV
jgi:hypothetical protein